MSERDASSNASDPSPLARRPRALAWLRAVMVTAGVGSALLLLYVGVVLRDAAVQDGRARLQRISQIGQQQAQRILETNEVISRSVAQAIEGRRNPDLRAGRAELHEHLRALTQAWGSCNRSGSGMRRGGPSPPTSWPPCRPR